MSNSLQPHGLHSPWNSPSQNTGGGSCSLLQGILPTQGFNPGLLHCRRILYQLSHQGSPRILERVAVGESKLAKMVCSGSLTPRFVNDNHVTVEIIYNTAHARHKVLTWSGVTLCCRYMWAPPRKWQHYCCVTAVSVGSAMREGNTGVCCYSCCTSQERINMSAVPMAPWVFF